MKHIHDRVTMSAAGLFAALVYITTSTASLAEDREDERDGRAAISHSVIEQGFASSPIPKDKLKLAGKDRALVGLGSYLVNGAGDCNGCHSSRAFCGPAERFPERTEISPAILRTRAAIRNTATRTWIRPTRA